ncbi:hypothetical protein J6590_071376 [Homalodisca vitripennis]|nr:hypothetical protein J6590_071376 [Homalodisca vitripennis]
MSIFNLFRFIRKVFVGRDSVVANGSRLYATQSDLRSVQSPGGGSLYLCQDTLRPAHRIQPARQPGEIKRHVSHVRNLSHIRGGGILSILQRPENKQKRVARDATRRTTDL